MNKIIEDIFQVEVKFVNGSYGMSDFFAINIKDNINPAQRSKDDKGFPMLNFDWKEGKTVEFVTTTDQRKTYFSNHIISITFSRSYEDNN